MRKCKREIPECMKASKSRETKTSTFGFNDQITMVSYVLKKNKSVIMLSTMHHDINIDEEDPKMRPEIIKFYNKTKIGVDLVDQMVQTYTCRRQTRRWPLNLFCNLLDIAALNAYTVFGQIYPDLTGCRQGTYGMPPPLCGRQVAHKTSKKATPKRVRTSRPKYSDTIRFLVNGG